MQILAALTSAAVVEAIGNIGELFDTCTPIGELVNKQKLAVFAPIGMFHRYDIYQLLLETWGRQNIVCNKKFVALNEEKDCVQVKFSDGSSIQANMVIGADGIYSSVRQTLFPTEQLIDSGVNCYRGITEFPTPLIAEKNPCCAPWRGEAEGT